MFKRSLFIVTMVAAASYVSAVDLKVEAQSLANHTTTFMSHVREVTASQLSRFASIVSEKYGELAAQTSRFVATSVKPTAQSAYTVVMNNKPAALATAGAASIFAAYKLYKKYVAQPVTVVIK